MKRSIAVVFILLLSSATYSATNEDKNDSQELLDSITGAACSKIRLQIQDEVGVVINPIPTSKSFVNKTVICKYEILLAENAFENAYFIGSYDVETGEDFYVVQWH